MRAGPSRASRRVVVSVGVRWMKTPCTSSLGLCRLCHAHKEWQPLYTRITKLTSCWPRERRESGVEERRREAENERVRQAEIDHE